MKAHRLPSIFARALKSGRPRGCAKAAPHFSSVCGLRRRTVRSGIGVFIGVAQRLYELEQHRERARVERCLRREDIERKHS